MIITRTPFRMSFFGGGTDSPEFFNKHRDSFDSWLTCCGDSERNELQMLDEKQIDDAFFRELAFGTGGLRGRLGLGPNRMNVYTVGKATQGLADYLNSTFENPTVALCRDTRHGSEEFVRRAAMDREVTVIEGMDELLRELRYQGNNLNQLTVMARQGRITQVNYEPFTEVYRNAWQTLNSLLSHAV